VGSNNGSLPSLADARVRRQNSKPLESDHVQSGAPPS
jgi:hypothetical protein